MLDAEWRDEQIGRTIELAQLALPEPSAAFVLPSDVARRLKTAGEIIGWSGSGLLQRPKFAGDFKNAAIHLLCHAHHQGWGRTNMLALASVIESHECLGWAEHEGDDDQTLYNGPAVERVDLATWMVDGGPPPKGWDPNVEHREPDAPVLTESARVEHLHMLERFAYGAEWTGRRGKSCRAVYLHLVRHAMDGGDMPTLTPLGPVRSLSEATNLSQTTVASALLCLRESGHLKMAVAGSGGQANAYMVRWPASGADMGPVVDACVSDPRDEGNQYHMYQLPDFLDLSHPAFHQSCLGQVGFRLLDALVRVGPFGSDQEWMQAASTRRSAFYEAKRTLAGELGIPLIKKGDTGWTVCDDVASSLVLLAEQSGASERVDHRRAESLRQRTNWATYRARHVGVDLDRFEIRDTRTAVDRLTGEVVGTDELIASVSEPPEWRREERPTNATPDIERPKSEAELCAVAEALKAADTDDWAMTNDQQLPEESDDMKLCRACGRPTSNLNPDLGISLHEWCLFPDWICRIERRNGAAIPDRLIKPKPEPDWGEFAPDNDNIKEIHIMCTRDAELLAVAS